VEDSGRSVREYVWGGSNCPARDLTEEEIANLSRGLGQDGMRIIPIYVNGQLPDTRCLVEYILIDQRHVDAAEPYLF
jgi:hypothetical protein